MVIALNELVALEVEQEEISLTTLSHREFLMFVNFDGSFTDNKILLDSTNYQDELSNIDASSQDAVNTWFLSGGKKLQVWRYVTPLDNVPTCMGTLADISIVSQSNETLNGEGAYTSGDRILLVGQLNLEENGVWIVDSGAWTRDTDADTVAEIQGFCILDDVNNIEYYFDVDDTAGEVDAGALITILNRTDLLNYASYKEEFLSKSTPRQIILGINNVDLLTQEERYTALTQTLDTNLSLIRLDLLPRYFYLTKKSFTDTTTLNPSRFLSFVYDNNDQNVWLKYLTNLDDFGVYKNADFQSLSNNLGIAENSNNFEIQVIGTNTGILDTIESKPASVTYFVNMVDSEGIDITANFIREDLDYIIKLNILDALVSTNNDGSPLVVKDASGIGIINSIILNAFSFLEPRDGSPRVNFASIKVEVLPLALQNENKKLKGFVISYEYLQQVNRVSGTIKETITTFI